MCSNNTFSIIDDMFVWTFVVHFVCASDKWRRVAV